MIYWKGSFYEYVKFGIILLILKYLFESVELINNLFTKSIPVGWIIILIVLVILIKQILWLLKWSEIWYKQRYKREWLIIHWGIYLIVVLIVFSLSILNLYENNIQPTKSILQPQNIETVGKLPTISGSTEKQRLIGTWKINTEIMRASITLNLDNTGTFSSPFYGNIFFNWNVQNGKLYSDELYMMNPMGNGIDYKLVNNDKTLFFSGLYFDKS